MDLDAWLDAALGAFGFGRAFSLSNPATRDALSAILQAVCFRIFAAGHGALHETLCYAAAACEDIDDRLSAQLARWLIAAPLHDGVLRVAPILPLLPNNDELNLYANNVLAAVTELLLRGMASGARVRHAPGLRSAALLGALPPGALGPLHLLRTRSWGFWSVFPNAADALDGTTRLCTDSPLRILAGAALHVREALEGLAGHATTTPAPTVEQVALLYFNHVRPRHETRLCVSPAETVADMANWLVGLRGGDWSTIDVRLLRHIPLLPNDIAAAAAHTPLAGALFRMAAEEGAPPQPVLAPIRRVRACAATEMSVPSILRRYSAAVGGCAFSTFARETVRNLLAGARTRLADPNVLWRTPCVPWPAAARFMERATEPMITCALLGPDRPAVDNMRACDIVQVHLWRLLRAAQDDDPVRTTIDSFHIHRVLPQFTFFSGMRS